MKKEYKVNQHDLVEPIYNVILIDEESKVINGVVFEHYPSACEIAQLLIENEKAIMVRVDKYTTLKEGNELEKFKEALSNPNTINLKLF